MTHRFPIKEIARQAGLGPATVDRVLNNRAHVSPQTRLRVAAAIDELKGQETQLAARGRRLFFDVVTEAPTRFSREVRAAAEAVLPDIGLAVCRPRFVQQEIMEEDEILTILARIQKRGSHGVCLKARDTPRIRDAVNALSEAGIPVVTLVTDVLESARLAYVGPDNGGAGRTAAYLISKIAGDALGTVLATRSHESFSGEEKRETAFIKTLEALSPNLTVVSIQGGSGVDYETSRMLSGALDRMEDLIGVYSMGGGNRSILGRLDDAGLTPKVYVAHDLDRANRDLIRQRRIDFVLYHDLRLDMRNAFTAFLSFHRLSAEPVRTHMSTAQVITPENMPVR